MTAREELYLFAMVGKTQSDSNRAAVRKLDAVEAAARAAEREHVLWVLEGCEGDACAERVRDALAAAGQAPAPQPTRLVNAARRALDSLNDLIANTSDPGVEALGARWELSHALIGASLPAPQPDHRAELLAEAADVAHREGDRLYDDAGQAAAEAAWGVSDVLRALAAAGQAPAPQPETCGVRTWRGVCTLRPGHVGTEHDLRSAGACTNCGHSMCTGDGPCGALMGVGVGSENRCSCTDGRGAPAPQPETTPQLACRHCGREVQDRGEPSITGPYSQHWVHVPGGHAVCYPQEAGSSPTAAPQPETAPDAEGVRITLAPGDADTVRLYLPEYSYMDTQVWSIEVDIPRAHLGALRAAINAVAPAPDAEPGTPDDARERLREQYADAIRALNKALGYGGVAHLDDDDEVLILVDTVLAVRDDELARLRARVAELEAPEYYVADYPGSPLTLWSTADAARAHCDEREASEAHGHGWDWEQREPGLWAQVRVRDEDDATVGDTGATVTAVTIEARGESTQPDAEAAPCLDIHHGLTRPHTTAECPRTYDEDDLPDAEQGGDR